MPGYEALGLLGRVGMGVVYKARDRRLGRVVALKMILHAEYAGPEERRRFQAEAEAVARLQHPNVVQVVAGAVPAGGAAALLPARLAIRSRGKLSDGPHALPERVWRAYRAASRRSFA